MGQVILLLSCLWILWAFYNDSKSRPSVSSSVWIPIVWLFIHGTRSVSMWLGLDATYSRDEGNPFEALVNLALIVAGVWVLRNREVQVSAVARQNAWLFILYGFWCLSIAWSDYPLITFKRLFKDLGNVIMVLTVLTEKDPDEAARAVGVRFAYLCIPLSIVFIRYFPALGRIYVGEHRDVLMYIGVSTQKNLLGILVLMAAIFLLWELLERTRRDNGTAGKGIMLSHAIVLLMCWYLLLIINSATALVCTAIGSGLIILSRTAFKERPTRIETFGLAMGVGLGVLDYFFNIKEAVIVGGLGRNMTLTSRTDIWQVVSEFVDNPLVGAGFDTFWAGERLRLLEDKTFGIIQAHNGYIETYLNGGWIGVGLVMMVLASGYWKARRQLISGNLGDVARYALLLIVIIHNYTEASFNKNGPMWFVALFAVMLYKCELIPLQPFANPRGRDPRGASIKSCL